MYYNLKQSQLQYISLFLLFFLTYHFLIQPCTINNVDIFKVRIADLQLKKGILLDWRVKQLNTKYVPSIRVSTICDTVSAYEKLDSIAASLSRRKINKSKMVLALQISVDVHRPFKQNRRIYNNCRFAKTSACSLKGISQFIQ